MPNPRVRQGHAGQGLTAWPRQVVSLLGSEFGLALPPTLAFDFPTLEGLANYLAASLQVRLLRRGLQALRAPLAWGEAAGSTASRAHAGGRPGRRGGAQALLGVTRALARPPGLAGGCVPQVRARWRPRAGPPLRRPC